MGKVIDLTGQRFGKLVVISRAKENTRNGTTRWICKCDCGNMTTVTKTKLTRGLIVSCGCYRSSKNGESHTRLYRIWYNMHKRCEDPKKDHFDKYGGRGIRVCAEWSDFFAFKLWAMTHGYTDDLSIDRIDGDGNYEPSNCQWITQKQQMQNISTNRHITFNGKTYTVPQFADSLSVPIYSIRNHLRAGWSIEKIVEYENQRAADGKT